MWHLSVKHESLTRRAWREWPGLSAEWVERWKKIKTSPNREWTLYNKARKPMKGDEQCMELLQKAPRLWFTTLTRHNCKQVACNWAGVLHSDNPPKSTGHFQIIDTRFSYPPMSTQHFNIINTHFSWLPVFNFGLFVFFVKMEIGAVSHSFPAFWNLLPILGCLVQPKYMGRCWVLL